MAKQLRHSLVLCDVNQYIADNSSGTSKGLNPVTPNQKKTRNN